MYAASQLIKSDNTVFKKSHAQGSETTQVLSKDRRKLIVMIPQLVETRTSHLEGYKTVHKF